MAGIAFVSHGLRIGIRVSDAAILDRLPGLVPWGARLSTSPFVEMLYSVVVGGAGPRRGMRRYHVVYSGGTRMVRTHDLDEALELLSEGVKRYVSVWAPRRIFVRAGVVAWRGRAILIPGGSHSGKSRLVRALVEAGAEYYSDAFAVLDSRGRVHPFPLPLEVLGPGSRRARAVGDLGGRTGRRPLPVALVVVTRYVPGGRFEPRVLSRGRAVLELLSHTVPARRSPDRALEALSRVVAEAPVVKGPRGEADRAVSEILDVERWLRTAPVRSSAPFPCRVELGAGG